MWLSSTYDSKESSAKMPIYCLNVQIMEILFDGSDLFRKLQWRYKEWKSTIIKQSDRVVRDV